MKKILCMLALVIGISNPLPAQEEVSFENGIPFNFSTNPKGELSVSSTYYKHGSKSMKWDFNPNSVMNVRLNSSISLTSNNVNEYAFDMWIYNEEVANDSLVVELLSSANQVVYRYAFRLSFKGWRSGMIGLKHMQKVGNSSSVASYRVSAPNRKGSLYIDKLNVPVKKRGISPDNQLPFKDETILAPQYEWAMYEYDIPLLSSLTAEQQSELQSAKKVIDEYVKNDTKSANKPELIQEAKTIFSSIGIKRSGKGFIGKPFLGIDEVTDKTKEITWYEVEKVLLELAIDGVINKNESSVKDYLLFWEYLLDQGFAWGSGIGRPGNYIYSIKGIYNSALLMYEHIHAAPHAQEIISALNYWSRIGETKHHKNPERDAILDTWHNTLYPQAITAMLEYTDAEKYRAMQSISRWLSETLLPTPGTLGGIKMDGSTFHHGGFYPAYTVYAFGNIGRFLHMTRNTSFLPSLEARKSLKKAAQGMRNYSNKYEWAIGLSGRHPFGLRITPEDVEMFAHLALAGDLSDQGKSFDEELGADYMRLTGSSNTKTYRELRQKKVRKAPAPHGMFVYNHGAVGIYRQNEWAITIKGFNENVWSSEIFPSDNKYGRYQSYGSVQIFNKQSRKESGYEENGWDWNRLPGTTTIHLPWKNLETYSLQDKSSEKFAGSCDLNGESGMFAMKLKERNSSNFTPSFVARKSVFCFGSRLICLGSNISNSNRNYETETTLFQSTFYTGKEALVNGEKTGLGYRKTFDVSKETNFKIRDGYNNYYYLKEGKVTVNVDEQESMHEKKKTPTWGNFSSAWIEHGKAPENQGYEYLIWVEPNETDVNNVNPLETYKVIQKDEVAHIVTDQESGTTAYAVFETLRLPEAPLINEITRECMVMVKKDGNKLNMSICDPDLNLGKKGYTVSAPSRTKIKFVQLKGKWKIEGTNNKVKTEQNVKGTLLTITCQYGIPVQFTLVDSEAESGINEAKKESRIKVVNNSIYSIYDEPIEITLYSTMGICIAHERIEPNQVMKNKFTKGVYIVETKSQHKKEIQKIII